jgi:hypothetical protein
MTRLPLEAIVASSAAMREFTFGVVSDGCLGSNNDEGRSEV